MGRHRTHILVLNYDGRALLEECLPSVAAAAETVGCPVTVIDNGSRDDSLAYLRSAWPSVGLVEEPNRGLASFNAVLQRLDEPTALLLNNDVKLEPDAVGPLLRALEDHPDALYAAPCCWTFDGASYEGMRTRVRDRYGLVQGMSRVPGHEAVIHLPDLTAAAGPVLLVRRRTFLELGGYDPLYFPGRIEDLDLGFRAWMAGLKGYYVPDSIAYHRGFGAFGPAFGRRGCDRLALRNTLLFCWKNLAGPRLATHLAWLAVRAAHAGLTGRIETLKGIGEAFALGRRAIARRKAQGVGSEGWVARQEAFFERFAW